MSSLEKYLQLIKDYPFLFSNTGELGEYRIIKDPIRIKKEQKRIREELRKNGQPDSWIDIGVFSEDQWFWVVRDMVEFPGGKIGGYIRLINRKSNEGGGFNVVLICIQNNQILLIRRYRHEERDWSWEFPRGFGEPGLTAEENAQKELEEEIGISASQITLLTKVQEGNGGTAVFYVEISPEQKLNLEIGEGISNYRWISLSEIDEMVIQGKLEDWFSLWAYTTLVIKIQHNKTLI